MSLRAFLVGAGPENPGLITLVERRDQRAWFEHLPLFGQGVLVTRPRHQAAELMRRLEILGAVPYLLPAVEIRDPPDWTPVDRALGELDRYGWVVFTSSNGVHALIRRLRQTGRDLRAWEPYGWRSSDRARRKLSAAIIWTRT